VALYYEDRRDRGLPALLIKTETIINRDAETVFNVIAANPNEFWRWMTDRCNPGGLTVAEDWPKEGSHYRYKKRSTTRILTPFKPWDTGVVRVNSIVPNKKIAMEEHQESINCFIKTTHELEGTERGPGTRATILKSEYVIIINHWLFRRLFSSLVLSFLPSEMLKQTANIIAVCESL
jgi:uncharacterized protein YndB with AHSA1/START domain